MSGTLRYLLDTNILSDLLRAPTGACAKRLARVAESAVATSIIVACALRYGVAKKGSAALAARVEAMLEALPVLPFDADADRHYGAIRCALEASGTPIGANDLLIAAHARAIGLTLVTDNEKEFRRVPQLKLANWLARV